MRIRQIEDHLEIRIRHYAMRFLCLVLFVTSNHYAIEHAVNDFLKHHQ